MKSEGKLILSTTKYNALVDFLSCYPTVISKAAPHDATSAGFVNNGQLDSRSYCYPDMTKILGTCKTAQFTMEMERRVKANFIELYKEQVKYGMLTDDVMEHYKFRTDRDFNGKEVRRVSQCEAWQRAKCLSAKYQRDLRQRKLQSHENCRSEK